VDPDLFMKRVEQNGDWTLMCPNECPGLADTWGEKFEALYEKYESEGKGRKTIKAQDLWFKILESQIETGTPYILFKDAPTQEQPAEPRHHQEQQPLHRDHRVHQPGRSGRVQPRLHRPAEVRGEGQVRSRQALRGHLPAGANLNRVIDQNYYPIPEARRSNMRHRPIGIGVQGLADAFILMRYPFDSVEAKVLNREIFETIYYAALTASKDLAKEEGPTRPTKAAP
jgi:ribonucleotide reductase alpha subunit